MRTLFIVLLIIITLGGFAAWYFLIHKKKVIDPVTGENVSTESDILLPGSSEVNPATMATLYPELAAEIAANPILAAQILARPALKDEMNTRPGKNVILTGATGLREGYISGTFHGAQPPYMMIPGTNVVPILGTIDWPAEQLIQVGSFVGHKYSEDVYSNVNYQNNPTPVYVILNANQSQPGTPRTVVPKVYTKII